MVKKVVIITYDMIPHTVTWGGCQRMYYLSEFLEQAGIEVTVFSCAKGSYNYFGNKISFRNVSINIRNRVFNSFLLSKGRTETTDLRKKGKLYWILYKARKMVKNNKTLFNIINYLDKKIFNEPGSLAGFISRSWVNSSKKEILEYVKVNEVKNIIISAPPFGMFSIAKDLSESVHDANVIFDYRDPWNLWHNNSKLATMIENKYLKYANHIVCTNANLTLGMSKRFCVDISKFAVIENGYSSRAWCGISELYKKNQDYMLITYVGVMDLFFSSSAGYRDISVLLEAFEACLKDNKKIVLKFVGITNLNSEYAVHLKKKYKENIQFVGVLNNRDSNIEMTKSDILLLLHTTNDDSSRYLVSGKMYDYIKANRMIFSIGAVNGLHEKLVKEENLGICCTNKFKDIYNSLNYMYSLWENDKVSIDIQDTYRFSREYQNKKYMTLLYE